MYLYYSYASVPLPHFLHKQNRHGTILRNVNGIQGFEKVEIPSTKDGEVQKAFMYKSTSKTSQPLIVSLHTWSGYYNQTDPLTKEILARDWNYIHPDFRGANRTPRQWGAHWLWRL